jgi:hypothetical protein
MRTGTLLSAAQRFLRQMSHSGRSGSPMNVESVWIASEFVGVD